MTLMNTILQTFSAQSLKSQKLQRPSQSGGVGRSPPPEVEVIEELIVKKKRRLKKSHLYKIGAKVDSSPPAYHARQMFKKAPEWVGRRQRLTLSNLDVLTWIKDAQMSGRVDHRWQFMPPPCQWAYANRVNALHRIARENKQLYIRLVTQGPKVVPTDSLMKDWSRNRADIIQKAECKFVLFPPVPTQLIEDPAFLKPPGVKRPRVYFTVHMEGFSDIGELCVELFTDVCPNTCGLFQELLAGDGVGFSYVNTHFFRKVPDLYWAGGDVAHDNGFGCYAQKGRCVPIGAENYHFSHSMPGLLSMSVTRDDEMCGIFYITFKPLPQLDLKNVVFGRGRDLSKMCELAQKKHIHSPLNELKKKIGLVIGPSSTFEAIRPLGSALSPRPPVTLSASRQKVNGRWLHGVPNTRLQQLNRLTHIRKLKA